jgi:signal recognition particle receptor subunit beta
MPENVESLANLEENLQTQGESLATLPYVFQYNKQDLPEAAPVHYLEYLLNNRQERQPSVPAVAPEGKGVFETLNLIARLVLHRFLKMHAGKETKEAPPEKSIVLV